MATTKKKKATRKKPGPKPSSSAAKIAAGWRTGAAKNAPVQRPKAWSRELPGESCEIEFTAKATSKILVESCGYDPLRDSAGCMFDEVKAREAVRWIHRHCTHVKGSLGGSAFEMTPLQQAVVASIFGWVREVSGFRRYRKFLLYVARKWGKTLFAAAIALLVLLEADDYAAPFDYREEGVESYCAAAARDQAGLLWGAAKRMIQNDEGLSAQLRIYQHSVARRDAAGELDGSYFRAIPACDHTAHGFNPQCHIDDELHAWPTGELLDVLDTGMGSRDQPIAGRITTADYDRESICNEELAYAKSVRDGSITDPYYLPVIFEASADDDWTDPKVWARVNPNYPVTPTHAYMESACKKAQAVPRYQNTFKRLHLNIKTASDVVWLDMEKWDACATEYEPESLWGRPCYAGLDLSTKRDLTALVLYFPEDDNAVLPFFWAPGAAAQRRIEKNLLPSYAAWANEGHLRVCGTEAVDYDEVHDLIMECVERFDVQAIAFDRYQANWLEKKFEDQGVPAFSFGQGYQSMSEPSKELEEMVVDGRLRHNGHPVLRWNAANAMVQTDTSPAQNIKPVKAQTKSKARNLDDNKIDGIVALVMAIGIAQSADPFDPGVFFV